METFKQLMRQKVMYLSAYISHDMLRKTPASGISKCQMRTQGVAIAWNCFWMWHQRGFTAYIYILQH